MSLKTKINLWWFVLFCLLGWISIFSILYYFANRHQDVKITPHNECIDGVVYHIDENGTSTQMLNDMQLPQLCIQ